MTFRETLRHILPAPIRRLVNHRRHYLTLLRNGNTFSLAPYVHRALINSKRELCVSIGSRRILVRANTPDVLVAGNSLSGEFDESIKAAQPLQHNFIIDAGGYIGTAAIVFAEAFPAATVVTLEPSRENFALLSRNVRPYPNIVAINAALGDRQGVVTLRDVGEREWGYSIVDGHKGYASATIMHDVEVTTIPSLLRRFDATGIDLLKLDIEGSELSVLRASADWISSTRVIIAELHDGFVPGCTEAFEAVTQGWVRVRCGEKILAHAPSYRQFWCTKSDQAAALLIS